MIIYRRSQSCKTSKVQQLLLFRDNSREMYVTHGDAEKDLQQHPIRVAKRRCRERERKRMEESETRAS